LLNENKHMFKEKFVYNTQTLRYEKVEESIKSKVFKVLGITSSIIVTSMILMFVTLSYFPSPKEKALMKEIEQMEYSFMDLNVKLDELSKVLVNVQDRDASVHRMMFGMDPIDNDVWNGGIGGADRYGNLVNYKNSGALLITTNEKVDKLKRQMSIQSKSLDEIENLAKDKEKMMASIPALTPVRSDKLKRSIKSLSGFGMRIHPILKRRKMHAGIDFTCPKGTPVQASGDGKIIKVQTDKRGYGKHIIIDHGYGYKTKYAHLSEFDVKKGQTVKRGQVIGKVGTTGLSTAPHLHFEVIYKGRKVNPIDYCMDGLSPEEYQQLVNMASIANQSFD